MEKILRRGSMSSRRSSEEIRSLLHARFDALLADSEKAMDNAAYGQTVHDLDDFLTEAGRTLLKEVYQEKLQERIAQTETFGEAQQCPQCKKKRTTKTRSRKV